MKIRKTRKNEKKLDLAGADARGERRRRGGRRRGARK